MRQPKTHFRHTGGVYLCNQAVKADKDRIRKDRRSVTCSHCLRAKAKRK